MRSIYRFKFKYEAVLYLIAPTVLYSIIDRAVLYSIETKLCYIRFIDNAVLDSTFASFTLNMHIHNSLSFVCRCCIVHHFFADYENVFFFHFLQMNREEMIDAQRRLMSSAASSNDDVTSNRYAYTFYSQNRYVNFSTLDLKMNLKLYKEFSYFRIQCLFQFHFIFFSVKVLYIGH